MKNDDTPSIDTFENCPVSRRDFVRLSVATAGALTLSGRALGDAQSAAMTDEYEFVVAHTEENDRVPTLARVEDESGFERLGEVTPNLRTTTEPEPAAYARLTPEQAVAASRLSGVTELAFAPGSNPFWKLGRYPDGVFPAVGDSVDWIDFDQMVDGMRHLEERHADRLTFYPIGRSPGYFNFVTEREEPREVWVAEVTNDVDDEVAFRRKRKVFFSLSIHADERAGAEAGTRFVEDLLEGEEPETEALLDDLVLVFLFPNPDGWVARYPQYNDGENAYQRGTAGVGDPNRSYPTIGWIDPTHYPAEPNGTNLADDRVVDDGERRVDPERLGIDADVDPEYTDRAPDSLAIVEHFRDYENLTYGSDLHGMTASTNMIEGLVINDQFEYEELHDLYELNRVTGERLEPEIGSLVEENRALFEELNRRMKEFYDISDDEDLDVPEQAFDAGTIYDTLEYSTTGILVSHLAQPVEQGGLGLTAMAHEMAYSNRMGPSVEWRPDLAEIQVRGYRSVVRTMSEHAAREVRSTVETGDRSTAFVTTDALARSSGDVEFVEADAEGEQTTETVEGARQITVVVPEGAASLSVRLNPDVARAVDATLRNPVDEAVRRLRPLLEEVPFVDAGAGTFVADPDPGEWTIDLENGSDEPTDVDVQVEIVRQATDDGADGDGRVRSPDPRDVLGFEQRPYRVSPFSFFDDYERHLAADDASAETLTPYSVGRVGDGALLDGGDPARDNLVVVHDDGIDDAAYVDALDRFVEAGGNLVLTDTAVNLLGAMDAELVADVAPEHVSTDTFTFAVFGEKTSDHDLLAGVDPIQRELWKLAPLGYAIDDEEGEAPMTLVDRAAFTDAGGRVAATTDDRVAAGSLTGEDGRRGVHVVGSLLPPARQTHLHPFGMAEYTLSFLGQTVLTNALGYRQDRYVDGELVGEFGATLDS